MNSFGERLLSKKGLGILGCILIILPLFLPVAIVSTSFLGTELTRVVRWKDEPSNYLSIAFIVIICMAAVWKENIYTVVITGIALVKQVITFIMNYKDASNMVAKYNSEYGSDVFAVKIGTGGICFLVGCAIVLIALVFALKDAIRATQNN